MTVIQKVRDSFLPADEQAYRKSGLKDYCGHWTDEARQIFVEQLMDKQANDVLLPIAQKLVDEQDVQAK